MSLILPVNPYRKLQASFFLEESRRLKKRWVWLFGGSGWLKKRIEVEGVPFFANDDPPWMPFFTRRNEVMMRLAAVQELKGLIEAKP